MCVDARVGMHIHFHLEVIKFFLDLLSKKRIESIASGNLSTAIIVGAIICVVNNDSGRKRNGSGNSRLGRGHAGSSAMAGSR